MEILRAVQVAKREWENIKLSLDMCGDIGEFDSREYMRNRFTPASEGLILFRNLVEMEKKLLIYRYLTQEAACVFSILASKAGQRLGLTDRLAQTFGNGYSLVRTGCLRSNGTEEEELKQMDFFKLFFPLGVGFNWKFNSPIVKIRFKTVLDKFTQWHDTAPITLKSVRTA